MKSISKKILKLTILGIVVGLFQGCSLKFEMPVSSPKTSTVSYSNIEKDNKIEIQFDSLLTKEHIISKGNKANVYILEYNKEKIKANEYIKLALEKEIKARGIGFNFVNSSNNKLKLEDFEIISEQKPYSPLVTISTVKVRVNIGNTTKTFISMIKRAKMFSNSLEEFIEICYNEPISLLIKEIVAKINKDYFGYKFTDEYIQQLESKILNPENERLTYIDVYELGFSNNLKVVSFLKELTSSNAQYIRLAAISSIGTLGDTTQFNFLVSLNKNSKMWQDRAMALKSIGDLGTEEAYSYLKERKSFWEGKTTNEALWNLKILNLYLD